jgi:hypothetical protein
MMPELLAQPQFRQASLDGDLLTLSATTHATVVRRRAGSSETASGGSIAWCSTMAIPGSVRAPEPEDDDEHGCTTDGRLP